MNVYQVTSFNYGNSQSVLVTASDVMAAINSSGLHFTEIIEVKLVGSSNINDLTN